MELRKVNELINNNIDEFEFGKDILDLKTEPCKGYVLENGLFTKAQWGNAKNIYLLSEQGYFALVMKLLKSLLRITGFLKHKLHSEINSDYNSPLQEFEDGIDTLDIKNCYGQ